MSRPSKISRRAAPAGAQAPAGSARGARAADAHASPALVQRLAAEDARAGEDARSSGPAREGEVRWRQLLAGGTPREILCRIVQGDPLGMRERVARRLHAEAYLLDADRVQLRALARCARFANRYPGRPELATWLDEIVDQAIEDLVREDVEGELEREKAAALPSAAFSALARPLGLEPEAMRRACAAFNQLPALDRTAFFALVLHGRSLDELARDGRESASDVARRARRALDLLLRVGVLEPKSPECKTSSIGTRTPEPTASLSAAGDALTRPSSSAAPRASGPPATASGAADRTGPGSSAHEAGAGAALARGWQGSEPPTRGLPAPESPARRAEDR
jgi:DNA-directed RNA polymerase specialized sigma24 family protein